MVEDKDIERVQRSTRTSFAAFIPLHNKLRMKFSWYYKWHLSDYASTIHLLILFVYILGLSSLGAVSYRAALPIAAQAAATKAYQVSGSNLPAGDGYYIGTGDGPYNGPTELKIEKIGSEWKLAERLYKTSAATPDGGGWTLALSPAPTVTASGANFIVSGAGYSDCNGTYTPTFDYYTFNNCHLDADSGWKLGHDSAIMGGPLELYHTDAGSPDGGGWSVHFDPGTTPTVSSVPAYMNVSGAGESGANGTYIIDGNDTWQWQSPGYLKGDWALDYVSGSQYTIIGPGCTTPWCYGNGASTPTGGTWAVNGNPGSAPTSVTVSGSGYLVSGAGLSELNGQYDSVGGGMYSNSMHGGQGIMYQTSGVWYIDDVSPALDKAYSNPAATPDSGSWSVNHTPAPTVAEGSSPESSPTPTPTPSPSISPSATPSPTPTATTSPGSGITISGTARTYDQSSNAPQGETVRVAVNGTLQAQTGTAQSDGTWSISGVTAPSVNDVITVFLDGVADANEANAVTKAGTGNITGVNLYEKMLSIGSDDNKTLSNVELSQYDNSVSGDEDIFFDVNNSTHDLTMPVPGTQTDSDQNLIIKSGNSWRPDSSGALTSTIPELQVLSNAIVALDNNTLIITGSGIGVSRPLKVATDGEFNSATSTVVYQSSSATDTAAVAFYNLVLNHSGTTFTPYNHYTYVNATFTIESGSIFDGSDATITLAGPTTPFVINGTFTPSTSTVIYTGSTATNITSATYYNLTIAHANNTFTFPGAATTNGTFRATAKPITIVFNSGSTYAFNTVNIAGSAGNLITLSPSGAANWTINPTTVTAVTYVDVAKSTDTGTAFCATYSTDSGGNTAWNISTGDTCPINISGSAKDYNGTGNAPDGETVKVAINGTLQAQTGLTSGGSWSISGVTAPATGDTVTVFIDGVADVNRADGITKYDGSGDITGINLSERHVSVGSDDNQTISDADMSKYDSSVSGDADLIFDVDSSNNLTLPTSGTKITVRASNTYRPAASDTVAVTVPALTIMADGALTLDNNSLILTGGGHPFTVTGTFYPGTSTVQYTSAAATQVTDTIYNNLVAANHTGNLFTAAGDITVNARMTVSAGTFDPADKTITLAGSGTPLVVNSPLAPSSSTFKYTGSSATNITAGPFYNITLDHADTTFTSTGWTSVSSVFNINAGTFDGANQTLVLLGSGTPFVIGSGGSFAYPTSTIDYFSSSTANITATDYYNLRTDGAVGGATYTFAPGTVHVHGSYNNNGNSIANANTNDPVIDIDGAFTNTAGNFTASNSAAMTVGGNFSNVSAGSFSHSNGTVTLDGTSNQSVTDGASPFYNLTITNASASPGVTFTDALWLTHLLKDTTPSSTLTFTPTTAPQSSIIADIQLNGGAVGTKITVRSTSTTAARWDVTAHPQTDVSYVDASYNDASSGSEIVANNGTDHDGGNTTNWLFGDETPSPTPTPSPSPSPSPSPTPTPSWYICGAGTSGANGGYSQTGTYSGLPILTSSSGYTIAPDNSSGATWRYHIFAPDGTALYSGPLTTSLSAGSFWSATPNPDGSDSCTGYLCNHGDAPAPTLSESSCDSPSPTPTATVTSPPEPPVSISGTAKAYDESANAPDGETVKIAVNGTLQAQTSTTSGGIWSISGVTQPTSGDTITVFIDGVADANEANAVTKYDGTGDITGINLFEKHLSLGSDDNQTISNADMEKYDHSVSSDEDIFFEVNDSTKDLSLPTAGTQTDTDQKLIVKAGNTWRPSTSTAPTSTVPILSIPASAAVTLDNNTLVLTGSGDPLSITGTFSTGTSTVKFQGATATNINALTYNNLVAADHINNTFTAAGNFMVGGVLTVNAGTFAPSNKTITLAGSGTPLVVNGTISEGTSTIKYTGSSATNISGTNYYNLTMDHESTTFTAAGDMTISHVFSLVEHDNAAVFNASNRTITLSGSGNVMTPMGKSYFESSTSTVKYTGSSATSITAAHYYNLIVDHAGNTFTVGNTIYAINKLTIETGTTLNGSGCLIVLNGSGTPFVINGTFVAATSRVFYWGGTNAKVASATYYTLQMNDGGGAAKIFTAAGDITVNHQMIIDQSKTTFDAADKTITLAGSGDILTLPGGGHFKASTSTVKYTGSGATNLAPATYYNLYLDHTGTTFTAAGDVTASSVLTINAGTFDASNRNIILSGSGTPFVKTGTFTPSSSTVKYTGSAATNITSTTYNNLTLEHASTTFTLPGDTTTNGTFTEVTAPATLIFNSGSTYAFNTVNIAGSNGKLITLAPSGSSNWNINPANVNNVSYVDVSKSTNTGGSFCATYSNDGGSNNNWKITDNGACPVPSPDSGMSPSVSVVPSSTATTTTSSCVLGNITQVSIDPNEFTVNEGGTQTLGIIFKDAVGNPVSKDSVNNFAIIPDNAGSFWKLNSPVGGLQAENPSAQEVQFVGGLQAGRYDGNIVFSACNGKLVSTSTPIIGGIVIGATPTPTIKDRALAIVQASTSSPAIPPIAAVLAALAAITAAVSSSFPVAVSIATQYTRLAEFFRYPAAFFGTRKKRPRWGVVYDSVTRQPVAHVRVQIFTADGRLRETQTTNEQGSFGFLVPEGEYRIVATKPGFTFPSNIMPGKADEQFQNVYHGEKITIKGNTEQMSERAPIDLSIPLDQTTMTTFAVAVSKAILSTEKVLNYMRLPVMIIGSVITFYLAAIKPSTFNLVVLAIYIALWVLEVRLLVAPKTFGTVSDDAGVPLGLVIIRALDPAGQVRATVISGDDGRFILVLKPGVYYFDANRLGYKSTRSDKIKISGTGDLGRVKLSLRRNIK